MSRKPKPNTRKAPKPAPPELARGRAEAHRLLTSGQSRAANVLCRKILKRWPEDVFTLTVLAMGTANTGDLGAAGDIMARAVAVDPTSAEARNNLGSLRHRQGRMDDAIAAFQMAINLDPARASAFANLGSALNAIGDFVGAEAAFGRALELRPSDAVAVSRHVCALNFVPGLSYQELFDAHRDYQSRVGAGARGPTRPLANAPEPERPLKIGYVSAEFGHHPVGFLLRPVIENHDRARFQPFLYSDRVLEDEMTVRFKRSARAWRKIAGKTDDEVGAQVRRDGIDILVDLAGHTGDNRLPVFAARPAPVQVSWIGYFHTTGLDAMDYVLMDATTVPPGAERWFSETLIRLPGGRFCYQPPDFAPPVAPPPVAQRGTITFGSFNNARKITAEVARVWARILTAVPDGRLILKWGTLGDPGMARRFRDRFEGLGIAPERLELRGWARHDQMLGEYGDIDIALDPFPFCGGLTTLEALWMGVPVVTWPQSRPVSRQSLGFLTTRLDRPGRGGRGRLCPDRGRTRPRPGPARPHAANPTRSDGGRADLRRAGLHPEPGTDLPRPLAPMVRRPDNDMIPGALTLGRRPSTVRPTMSRSIEKAKFGLALIGPAS